MRKVPPPCLHSVLLVAVIGFASAPATPAQVCAPTPREPLRRELTKSESAFLDRLFAPTAADRVSARATLFRLRDSFASWQSRLAGQLEALSPNSVVRSRKWIARTREPQPRFVHEWVEWNGWVSDPIAFAVAMGIRVPALPDRARLDTERSGLRAPDPSRSVTVWFHEQLLTEDFESARVAYERVLEREPGRPATAFDPVPYDSATVVLGALDDLILDRGNIAARRRLLLALDAYESHRAALDTPLAVALAFRSIDASRSDRDLSQFALVIADRTRGDWSGAGRGFEVSESCAVIALTLGSESKDSDLRARAATIVADARRDTNSPTVAAALYEAALRDDPSAGASGVALVQSAILLRRQHDPRTAMDRLSTAWNLVHLDARIPGSPKLRLDLHRIARELSRCYEDLRDFEEAYRWARIAFLDHPRGAGCGLGQQANEMERDRELARLEQRIAAAKKANRR